MDVQNATKNEKSCAAMLVEYCLQRRHSTNQATKQAGRQPSNKAPNKPAGQQPSKPASKQWPAQKNNAILGEQKTRPNDPPALLLHAWEYRVKQGLLRPSNQPTSAGLAGPIWGVSCAQTNLHVCRQLYVPRCLNPMEPTNRVFYKHSLPPCQF